MRRITLIPSAAMIAIIGFLIVVDKTGFTGSLRSFGVWLLWLLPLFALSEFAACLCDILSILKIQDRLVSRAFASRLMLHAIGTVLAGCILFVIGVFVCLGPINPG